MKTVPTSAPPRKGEGPAPARPPVWCGRCGRVLLRGRLDGRLAAVCVACPIPFALTGRKP